MSLGIERTQSYDVHRRRVYVSIRVTTLLDIKEGLFETPGDAEILMSDPHFKAMLGEYSQMLAFKGASILNGIKRDDEEEVMEVKE